MNKKKLIELYKEESSNVFNNIPTKKIVEFVDMVFEAYENEQTIFACGNGGNVASVQNLVVDMNMHPFVSEDIIKEFGGSKVENLDDGLKTCDYLSLHVPLTKKTKNMLNYSKLKSMKKNAIIINTSRGGIINETDLDKAINEKIIFGAGLDVFEKEPVDKNNPLLKNKKVLLSPHSATFTNECKSRMSLETTKNIIDFFENKIDKLMIVKLWLILEEN